MNKVPEDTSGTPAMAAITAEPTAMPENEQLELLVREFGGMIATKTIRGNKELLALILEAVDKTGSPTESITWLEAEFAAAKVIAKKLAKLKRDGHKYAADQMRTLLHDPAYFLPGMPEHIEDTRLITVLVLDFELILEIAKWVRIKSRSFHEHCQLREMDHPQAKKLVQLFPDIPPARRQSGSGPAALAEMYQATVKKAYPKAWTKIIKWVEEDGESQKRYQFSWRDHRVHWLSECASAETRNCFAFILDMPQDQVLEIFSREEQKRIATWQIRIPKAVEYYTTKLIGFHPEAYHDKVQVGGAIPSLGVSRGYGAAWLYNSPQEIALRYLNLVDKCQVHNNERFHWYGLEEYNEGDPFAFTLGQR